ncbi:MAG: type II toxin-antitoxin system HipA family toxin [Myxococcota bacterium]
MGALEYHPSRGPDSTTGDVDVAELVALADAVLAKRTELNADLEHDDGAINQVLQVGTSAGGARAKAVIAWNPETRVVRSGQAGLEPGFSHWVLKLDGVRSSDDREAGTTLGYGLVEYAYHKMADRAGVRMAECQILEEGGRHHFMTKRFDRSDAGMKLHMQSLAALAHYDYNASGAYSYEQAIEVMRRLELSRAEIEQQYRRTVFNIVARNQDDHVKNIAFLMDKTGKWSLCPAFDVVYSYNPSGTWTSRHQMSVNGKRDGFAADDLLEFARFCNLKAARARQIMDDVMVAVRQWPAIAAETGIPASKARAVERHHRRIG